MISILMPFKNESLHLKETIQSILKQTEPNFELIAVDDNSTDDSFELLTKMAEDDTRIKVYKSEGQGIIPALQFAQKNARGDYITRQDADDIMPEYKLEELKSILQINGAGHIATGKVKYFSSGELMDGFKKYERWINHLCETNSHYDQLFKECVVVSSNWMLHKKDFDLLNGFNDSLYPEDYHFVFKLFENDFKIISSQKITHLWRDHPARASRNVEIYQDQKFFPLKVLYFKKLVGTQNICLWGAGPTGKKLAQELIKNELPFYWVTNNENKIGKKIYDTEIFHFDSLREKKDHHLIISVTQRDALKSIMEFLSSINFSNFHEF